MAATELFSTPLYTDNTLLAYYRLEDAVDSQNIGTDYDLTNTGSVTFAATKFNNGADFNGGNSLNNNSVLGASSYPRSFVGWSIFDSVTSSDRTIFALGDGSIHYYAFKIRSSDSHIVFRSNNNTEAADVDTGIVATTATMYHWVVVQNSSTSVTIYINGTATNTNATTFVATVSQFYLGYLGRSSVWYMDGRTDDVAIFNRALTSYEVTNLYDGSLSSLVYSVAGYFKLDESSGNAADSVGGVGTLTNSNVTYSTGIISNGAVFNSTTDKLSVASPSIINFARTVPFSIAFWINRSSLTDSAFLLSKQNQGGTWVGYSIYAQSSGRLQFDFYDTSTAGIGVYTTSNFLTSTSTWYHVVLTYSGSSAASGVKIYINGDSKALTTALDTLAGTTTNSEPFVIGNRGDTYNANGTIDELPVYTRELTASEVSALYNSGAGLTYPFVVSSAIFTKNRITRQAIHRASSY